MLISLDHTSHLKPPFIISWEMDKHNDALMLLPHHNPEAIIYFQMRFRYNCHKNVVRHSTINIGVSRSRDLGGGVATTAEVYRGR